MSSVPPQSRRLVDGLDSEPGVMRRILLSAFLVFGLSLGLAACSSSPSSQSQAMSYAKQSCDITSTEIGTFGDWVAAMKRQSHLAAKAAALDARWYSLLDVQLDWEESARQQGNYYGMGKRFDPSMINQASERNAKIYRDQCEIANS